MNDHTTLVAALREAADLLEQHPDLPQPYITSSSNGTASLSWYLHGDNLGLSGQKDAAALIVSTIDGEWLKGSGDWEGPLGTFSQRRGLLRLTVTVTRDAVCERVVVGTETRTIPAVEAQPERTETVEKVEWRCQPLLADSPGIALAKRHIAEAKAAAGIGAA
jgi:hypothetical protein